MKTKILQNAFLTLTAGFAAALAPITVHAQSLVALSGIINQSTLVSQTCNGGVCTAVFEASGSVNIMGPVSWTITVVQDFNITPCNPGVSVATAVGATGSITTSDTCGIVCGPTHGGGPGTISSVWNVTGIGEFSGITGSGTYQGTIAGNGPNVHLSGIVVY